MKRRIPFASLYITLVVTVLSLPFGCGKRIVELKKERLFAIPIGDGIEEIGVVNESLGSFYGPRHVLFKNGFFYVVDEVNQKILKITTPGDIILVLSDGSGDSSPGESVLRTKERKLYDFNHIGGIAVDNGNNIYVENRSLVKKPVDSSIDIVGFGDEEQEYVETNQSEILKFDRLGNFLYSIGIDGKEGEPFDYIFNMEIDGEGSLVVLTTDENWESWTYHTYDQEGNHLLSRQLTVEDFIEDESDDTQASFVMDVVPAVTPDQIVCWISQYDTSHDTKQDDRQEEVWGEEIEIDKLDDFDQDQKGGAGHISDLLYYKLLYYDVKTGKTEGTHVWGTRPLDSTDTTEEFIGIDGQSNGFLWKYIDHTHSIVTIFKPDGAVVAKRSFVFEDDGIWTNLHVSVDGTVTAVKIGKRHVQFYRWRSDKLFGDNGEKKTLMEFLTEKYREFKDANR